MARNNFGMSPFNSSSSSSSSDKVQVPISADGCDGLDSENDIPLTSWYLLHKTETKHALHRNEDGNILIHKAVVPSNGVLSNNSVGHVDVVQYATDAVEGTLVQCPKHNRCEALAELLLHTKLKQVETVLAHKSDGIQHANDLMQAQKLDRIYPKEYERFLAIASNVCNALTCTLVVIVLSAQVHQLAFLVQQCVAKDEKHELPESDERSYRYPSVVQQNVSEQVEFCECVEANGPQQQKIGGPIGLSGRLEEVVIHRDVADDDEDDSIGDIILKESTQELSNQDEVDAITHYDDWDTSTYRDDTDIEELGELVKEAKLSGASTQTSRLRVLPILTANMIVKGICVPQLPRGRHGRYSSSSDFDNANTSKPSNIHAKGAGGSFRYKFEFSEKEVLRLLDDEEANADSTYSSALLQTYRRLSTNSKITVAMPLRRKSFSMKQNFSTSTGGFGSSHVAGNSTAEVARPAASSSGTKSTNQLWTARRKSTSACHIIASSMPLSCRSSRILPITKQQIIAFNNNKKAVASPRNNLSSSPRSPSPASSQLPPVPTSQTQMMLRVRERTSDGVPELVIAKKPVHFVMWHWNDRCVHVPFMNAASYIELGPAQHGIMLRQLRYVKLMMYELPWAKTHLRALLSKYTAKEVSKEELYPQLNALSQQVQRDVNLRAKQHRALTARKQRLSVTLRLAKSVVNNTNITKFCRRGRPHASRLRYDPNLPFRLHWRRKHGKWSADYLAVDEIQVIEVPDSSRLLGDAESFGRGNKKTVVALAVNAESCLSFVTPTRSLDLQVTSPLHREWLANAVRDLVLFAQQHKTTKTQLSE